MLAPLTLVCVGLGIFVPAGQACYRPSHDPSPRGRLFQMRLNIKNTFLVYKTQGSLAPLCHHEFWPSSSCQNLAPSLQLSTLCSLPPLRSSDRAALAEKQSKTKSSLLWLPGLHLHSGLYVLSRWGALKKKYISPVKVSISPHPRACPCVFKLTSWSKAVECSGLQIPDDPQVPQSDALTKWWSGY